MNPIQEQVQRFPVESLTPMFRNAVGEACRNLQVSSELAVSVTLGAASLACQDFVDVRRPGMEPSAISLYILVVAGSGKGKSTVAAHFLAPFLQFETSQREQAAKKLMQFKADVLVWKIEKKSIVQQIAALAPLTKKGGIVDPATKEAYEKYQGDLLTHLEKEPIKPVGCKILYNNATIEALLHGLSTNIPSAAIWSDEGGVALKSSMMSALFTLNDLWSGSTQWVDRISSDSKIVINVRLTSMIMVQESLWHKFLEGKGVSAFDNGYFARSLILYPNSQVAKGFIGGQIASREHVPKFQERIKELLAQYSIEKNSQSSGRKVLDFSTEAERYWLNEYNFVQQNLKCGDNLIGISGFAAKIPEQIARLAALMHYFEGYEGDISLDTVQRATEVIRWFAVEQMRVFPSLKQLPLEQMDAITLNDWFSSMVNRGYKVIHKSFIQQYGPNSLRKKFRLDTALSILQQQNRIGIYMQGKTQYIDLHAH